MSRESGETSIQLTLLFRALEDLASESAREFHLFMGAHEIALYPLLSPFGYQISQTTPQGTVKEFRAAYDRYLDAVIEHQASPGLHGPAPTSPLVLELTMWDAAATDPICAVYVGLSYLLAELRGDQLDPEATASNATAVSAVAGVLSWRLISPQHIKIGKNKTVRWLRNQYGDRLTTNSQNGRPEQLTGLIKRAHLKTGTGTTSASRQVAQDEGEYDAGHLRARLLGGKGDLWGTFPQVAAANRGVFRDLEGRIASLVKSSTPADKIVFSVKLNYAAGGSKAPTSVSYYVRINGRTVGRGYFSNTEGKVDFPLSSSPGKAAVPARNAP